MLNFNSLQISKLIIHTIIPKLVNVKYATAIAEPSSELVAVNNSVESILKTRLIDAAGKNGRAFKLSIADSREGSFFDLSKKFIGCSNEEFVKYSSQMSVVLATSQTRSNQPGGYLIIIHGRLMTSGANVFIAIKAEPHEALISTTVNGRAQIELLEKIFLSPSQKLYKIGILEEIDSSASNPNHGYNCYLFDDQFSNGLPAEYFYGSFLGFSIEENSKLQSFKFYSMTEQFIETNSNLDSDRKGDILNSLGLEFKVNSEPHLAPMEFARKYFEDEHIATDYIRQVVESLPSRIMKDKALISSKLTSKKIKFPRNIKISGPFDDFSDRVKIINDPSILSEISSSYSSGTLVYIAGKPFDEE